MDGEIRQSAPIYPPTPLLAAPGGHYSHVTVANGFVFVSGQLPITATGEKLVNSSFEVQAEQVLKNLEHALAAAGTRIEQLVQVRVYLDDIGHWPAFNDIYARWAGNARPARAIVPTGPLHFGLAIEVEATAALAEPEEARQRLLTTRQLHR